MPKKPRSQEARLHRKTKGEGAYSGLSFATAMQVITHGPHTCYNRHSLLTNLQGDTARNAVHICPLCSSPLRADTGRKYTFVDIKEGCIKSEK